MNLTREPETVNWPESHYVFIEKIGPFQNTAPEAWNRVHKLVPEVSTNNKITGYMSLYKFKPEMTYRAGLALAAKPVHLPQGLAYELFEGGKYARFVLTGPYSDLPEACGIVFKVVEDKKMKTRDGAFYIENYANDPSKLDPGEQPVIQILIPTI
jgi:DNA gyrase inhibitor GyrI